MYRSCPSRRRPFAAVLSCRRPLSDCIAVVHRERVAAILHHTGDHQNAAVALLGLFQKGTADDELIVGFDSLSIGNSDDISMEDTLADGDATDGNATDGDTADGDMEV